MLTAMVRGLERIHSDAGAGARGGGCATGTAGRRTHAVGSGDCDGIYALAGRIRSHGHDRVRSKPVAEASPASMPGETRRRNPRSSQASSRWKSVPSRRPKKERPSSSRPILHVQDRACESPGRAWIRAPWPAGPAAIPDPAPAAPAEAAAPEVVAVEPEATAPRPEAPAESKPVEADFDPTDFLFGPEPEPDPAAFLLDPAPPQRTQKAVLPQPEFVSTPAEPPKAEELSPSRRRPEHRKRRRPKSSGRTSRRPSRTIRCMRSRR